LIELGLRGKNIGEILNYLLEKVIEDNSMNNKKKLIELSKEKMNISE